MRNSGSRISTAGTTWAEATRPARSAIASHANLFARIHYSCRLIWGIRYHSHVGDESAHVGRTQSIAVRRHECGAIERRSAVLGDGRQIGVTHLIECVALRKGMRLHLEVVIIRNALRRRLRIMATIAILLCEKKSKLLLIAEGRFHNLNGHKLRFTRRGCAELISSGSSAQCDGGGCLPTGIGEQSGWFEAETRRSMEFN